MNYMGKNYTEVKDRIVEFLQKHPDGMIQTFVDWHSDDYSKVTIKATVYPRKDEPEYFFTGLAYEERLASGVNADAWVENCETSAIGRALANMNIGVTTSRPSAEEMKKVEKAQTARKEAPKEAPKETPVHGKKVSEAILQPEHTNEYTELSSSFDYACDSKLEGDLKAWANVNKAHIEKLPDWEQNKLREKYSAAVKKLHYQPQKETV